MAGTYEQGASKQMTEPVSEQEGQCTHSQQVRQWMGIHVPGSVPGQQVNKGAC